MCTESAQAREILVALPDCITDLYTVHQLVWAHVERAARVARQKHKASTPTFIYRVDSGMIRARSVDLPSGVASVSQMRESADFYLDIAALTGERHDRPVPAASLEQWCASKIERSGFVVSDLVVDQYEMRVGKKYIERVQHNIQIPVARLRAKLKTKDAELCAAAWVNGIGRGKRFGLGMLAH